MVNGSTSAIAAEASPIKKKQKLDNTTDVLNLNLENEIIVTGFRLVQWKWLLTMLAMVMSAGLLWLLLYWNPKWKLWWTHQVVNLDDADMLLVEDEYKRDYKRYYVERVTIMSSRDMGEPIKIPLPLPSGGSIFKEVFSVRYFECKKEMYIWDSDKRKFYLLRGIDHNIQCDAFYKQDGLSELEQAHRRLVFGSNDINVPDHSIGYLLVTEVLNPFYIFQVASVILWTSDEYYYYAAAIVIMSVSGIVSAVYQTKQARNMAKLHDYS